MQKISFLIVCLLFGFIMNGQIISFSGNSFKTRLLQANINNTIAKNSLGQYFKIDQNNNGEIEISEALSVSELNVNSMYVTNLVGISYFTNLVNLDCHTNTISSLDITPLVNLQVLNYSANSISSLVVNPTNLITNLNCGGNQITSFNSANWPNLTILNCSGCLLTNLNISSLNNLVDLNVSGTPISSIVFGNLTSLQYLDIYQMTSLNSLDLSTLVNLKELNASNINLTSIDISNLANLEILVFENNSSTFIDLSNKPNLKTLDLKNNQLATLDITEIPLLEYLYVDNNNISAIDFSNNPSLKDIFCQNNHLTSLDVSNQHALLYFYCSHNLITGLDLSQNFNLWNLNVGYNQMVYLNIKNGSNEHIDIQSNPNLHYVCTDEYDSNSLYYLYNNGYNFNSYCSFTPGGIFYLIQGESKFDFNNNGCDPSDISYPNMGFSITNSNYPNITNYFSNASANYLLAVHDGINTITPILENPNYFTLSPANLAVDFPTETSPFIQNFCISPNGIHNDLEVTIIPIRFARPGFDATYEVVYKNKGTTALSGSVAFGFEDDKMDLVSANPIPSSQAIGLLTFDYINLQPFESREVLIVMNINSQIETPAVNIGDELDFTAIINPLSGDEYLFDNNQSLKQKVVGSYDPNVKICVEGNVVGSDMIGQYVHYVIHFENTGTFPAENIVVKDIIDLNKFELASFIPISASHSYVTRVSDYGETEFIFENINLPFDDTTNDGYIAFKIKTKPTLIVGDTFENNANIYFDYNYPVTTNTTLTTIQTLENQDFEFSNYFILFPNPAKDKLHIEIKDNIAVKSVGIYNLLGQLVLTYIDGNMNSTFDISSLKNGSYFIKIATDKGFTSCKFIKN